MPGPDLSKAVRIHTVPVGSGRVAQIVEEPADVFWLGVAREVSSSTVRPAAWRRYSSYLDAMNALSSARGEPGWPRDFT